MALNSILKWAVVGGLFVLLFTPLIVPSFLFFPFITGKAFFFRIVVEFIFGGWIILAILDPKYRPRLSPVLWAVVVFIAIVGLATIFSVNPFKSFWSNFERMEGLVTHLHLLAYFLVTSSVLAATNWWQRFFQASLGVSIIVSLYSLLQLFGLITINQGGVRVDATFGNATYLAIYLVFHIFLAVWLFVRSNVKWQRYIYGLIIALESIILYFTATRGAILGLIAGVIVAAGILALKNEGRSRKVAGGVVLAIVVLLGLFVAVRNVPVIKDNPVLGRFASISLTERTTQSRFIIWGMGWQGFKEKPILGWGPENYSLVFNKYYNPKLWNQEQWFDRSHNVIFDWLISAGLLGFLTYLALFFAAFWSIKKTDHLSILEKSVFGGLLVAYFVHNLFVFDNLVSYLVFFTILAFLSNLLPTKILAPERRFSAGWSAVGAIIVVILTLGTVWQVNAAPLLANRSLIKGMTPESAANTEIYGQMILRHLDYFKQAIDHQTFGTTEIREQLAQWSFQVFASPDVTEEIKTNVAKYVYQQLSQQTIDNPNDARSHLFLALFLSKVGNKDGAIKELQTTLSLTPKKQTIYLEIIKAYVEQGNLAKAIETAKETFALDKNYPDARNLYASLLIYSGQLKMADQLLEEGFGTVIINDPIIINAYADARLFDRVLKIWQIRTDKSPGDFQNWVSLAAAYLNVGNRQKSIETLQKAITVNPGFKSEGEYYIGEIRAGRNP